MGNWSPESPSYHKKLKEFTDTSNREQPVRLLGPQEYIEHELGKTPRLSSHLQRMKPPSRFKLDVTYCCTYIYYAHLFMLVMQLMFLAFIIFGNLCESEFLIIRISLLIKIVVNHLNLLLSPPFFLPIDKKKNNREPCLQAIVFSIFGALGVQFLCLISGLYFFRVIEHCRQRFWLQCEMYAYLFFAFLYMVTSFAVLTSGAEFWILCVVSLFLAFLYVGLAAIRALMLCWQIPAQESHFDPDGNLIRAQAPNANFSFQGRFLALWSA